MSTCYVLNRDGRVYKTDNLAAKQPVWEEVMDPEEQRLIIEAKVMDLEEVYPSWRAAKEAWEAEEE